MGVGAQIIRKSRAFPLECGIPMVLNGVVGATIEQASYGSPLVTESCVRSDDGVVLLGSEGPVLHLRG